MALIASTGTGSGVAPAARHGQSQALPSLRGLLQHRHDAAVVVNTAEELRGAVQAGARDIEIRSHLDLTALRRTPSETPIAQMHPEFGKPTHLMYVRAATQSIRVRHDPPRTIPDTSPLVLSHRHEQFKLLSVKPDMYAILCVSGAHRPGNGTCMRHMRAG